MPYESNFFAGYANMASKIPHGSKPVLVLFVLTFMAGSLTVDYAQAQYYTGSLLLDSIPSTVRSGSTVIFSGQLTTTSGYVVQDATIYIKDDVTFGSDKVMGTVVTDRNGEFRTSWVASPRSSGSWDFYAVYEGTSNISYAKSAVFTVNVVSSSSNSDTSGSFRPSSTSSYAQTSIYLDPIPSSIYAGQSVTFTGRLESNGRDLESKAVKIFEDDPLLPDQRLGIGWTDSNGRFSIPWTASAGLVETDFDVYAVFDGDSAYLRARTHNQEMSVIKYGGFITLNSIPSSARTGDIITFSGTLNLDGVNPNGAVVYIKDEDSFSGDDLLVTGYVNEYGRFSADWRVADVDPDSIADIYAVFEGNDIFYRLTTCDDGPTRSFGSSCTNTRQIQIYDHIPSTPNIDTTGQYMKLLYSLPFSKDPHVVIVPSPDSYDRVKKHIVPVQEGIMMWETQLAQKYGGDWDVTFEVQHPSNPFFKSKPDIIVNLVTYDNDQSCGTDYSGVAYPSTTRPVQTTVCSTYNGVSASNADVSSTAAHEFVHAIGLGHTFNLAGDMMCSVENNVPTCPNPNSKSKTPSNLNLAGVIRLYGTDGFHSPNNYVQNGAKFVDEGSSNRVPEYIPRVPPATDPPPVTTDCLHDNYTYDQDVENLVLESGEYVWYVICSNGMINYQFSTGDPYSGFLIYLVAPESNVHDFINNNDGLYYTCEEYGTHWSSKSNTCNVGSGTKILLYNDGSTTLNISGGIWN